MEWVDSGELAHVEIQAHFPNALQAGFDVGDGVAQAFVNGIIPGDLHVVADAPGDFLVDDVPLALGALVQGHVVFVLDHGALAARFDEQVADHVAGPGGGQHGVFQPIHLFYSSFAMRASWSARVSAEISSSRSPSMMSSMRYSVSPMRWSVTRPWGKL